MPKTFDPAHAAAHGCTLDHWNAVDNPELTDEELQEMRPIRDAMPAFHAVVTTDIRKRGPVRTKTPATIRLDDAVVGRLQATGHGWQTRVNDVSKDWLAKAKGPS